MGQHGSKGSMGKPGFERKGSKKIAKQQAQALAQEHRQQQLYLAQQRQRQAEEEQACGIASGGTTAEKSHPFQQPLDSLREEEAPLLHLADITHFDVPTIRKLQVIFQEISESETKDGQIDPQELTQAMGLSDSCLLARAIFKIFDVTETRKINFRTWITTLSALSNKATLEEKIKFSFSLYDLNGDGRIDVEELRQLLIAAVKDSVASLSDAEVSAICDHTLSQVDRDGNGTVDFQEYHDMVKNSKRFLESFTVDVERLCGSFRFKRKSSTDRLDDREAARKTDLFRAKRRDHNPSESRIDRFLVNPTFISSSPSPSASPSHPELQRQGSQITSEPKVVEGDDIEGID